MQTPHDNSTELDEEWEASFSDEVRFGDQPSEQFFRERVERQEQRETSPLVLLRPAVLIPLLTNWIEEWFLSRNPFLVASGIPFLALAAWLGIQIFGRSADRQTSADAYRTILAGAERAADAQTSELCIRALIGLKPDDLTARMQLAELFWKTGRQQEAWQEFLALTQVGDHGFPNAHMWIVNNSRSETPFKKLTANDLMHHLQQVLAVQPRNSEAHGSLAELYTNDREWLLAEQHLQSAAEIADEWLIPLVELQRMLGKQQTAIDRLLEYEQKLTAGLARDPGDIPLRLKLAQTMALQNRAAEAVLLIEKQREIADSSDLQRYHSELLLAQARQLLNTGTINRDRSLSLVMQSLQLNPDNLNALHLAVDLEEMGAICPPAQSAELLAHWKKTVPDQQAQPDQQLGLALAAALDGQYSEAADRLLSLSQQRPDEKARVIFWLMQAGRSSEAAAAAASIADNVPIENMTETDQALAAQCLLAAGQYARVRTLLAADGERPSGEQLERLYGSACIREFDEAVNRPPRNPAVPSQWLPEMPGGNEDVRLLILLRTAASIPVTRMEAIDRLARVSLLSGSVAQRAQDFLLQLRSSGTDAESVLVVMGTTAMLNERWEIAIDSLQQANSLSMARNPVILNNLALATVRGPGSATQNALTLINQALELVPNNPELLSTRGEIFVAMQRWTDARRDLEESIRIRGGRPKVHRLLAQVWNGLNNPEQAEAQRQLAEQQENAATP
ncbi:MAG: hypothetical protein RIT02_1393 [Planctomycetota bacterium]|jgi:predicted Zn-dependent protease